MGHIKAFVEQLNGKAVLVYGLGKSGLSTVKALSKGGATVFVDDDNAENLEHVKALDVTVFDSTTHKFEDLAFIVLSPGIPLTHPEPHKIVQAAQSHDVEIICDIELFSRIYTDVKTIAITGTNGKSTTTVLMDHILRECDVKALMGGNIGTPAFDMKIKKNTEWAIFEISSFQLDLCPTYRADISVLLNITPDHIDRHGSIENYAAVKELLFLPKLDSEYNFGIICSDNTLTSKIFDRAQEHDLRNLVEIATEKKLKSGVFVSENILHEVENGVDGFCGDMSEFLMLQGIHNQQNAACAFAITRKLGIAADRIWPAIESFPGLNHRQFLVRMINGVPYINDSKSTNAASAAVALGCRSNVYWIVGGRQKKNGLLGLEPFFSHIKHAFLIGESTDDFAKWFDKYGIEYTKSLTLDKAIEQSHKMAQDNRGQPGGAGVVLLSPACASFDQFASFEDRGEQFASLVKDLGE